MKKEAMKKIMKICIMLMFCLLVSAPVFADISTTFPSSHGQIGSVTNSAKKIWGTVTFIVQILAFAAVVFAGVRYMFAAADQKADIKKGLGMLTVGAILVFAASTVVQFVVNAANEII